MYVLSAKNKRVSIQLLGGDKIQDKLSRLNELTSASLPFLGVSCLGVLSDLASVLPNLKLLDLTGNLIYDWEKMRIMKISFVLREGLSKLVVVDLFHLQKQKMILKKFSRSNQRSISSLSLATRILPLLYPAVFIV
ncbi:unnamed protein product [Eruca vesicaria subsp. sativa]|uniref:Uncharacterized protein n=1 Tax=Eruca vesicaria subsp. sativa TaxID=29727 RepID=A0ABC8JQF2_ERUVS|nr:unnamed protein product [Eruca vesicaria subsp. sativa]